MSATTTTERLPRAEALDLASQAIRALLPYCERIEIAGSIRRRAETVGDIELVAIPRLEWVAYGLFEDDKRQQSRLDIAVDSYLNTPYSRWQLRPAKNGRTACGERYKRLTYEGFPLDLFIVIPPAQWGVIMAIRTGPALYSHAFVSHPNVRLEDGRYGVLPFEMKVQDGALHNGAVIETPEESDFFNAINQEWIEPWERR